MALSPPHEDPVARTHVGAVEALMEVIEQEHEKVKRVLLLTAQKQRLVDCYGRLKIAAATG